MRQLFCFVLLLLFIFPVLYGLEPAPLSSRLERISEKTESYNLTMPSLDLSAFDDKYEEIRSDGFQFRDIKDYISTFFNSFANFFAYLGKVIWFFLKDVAFGLEAFTILVFNV